MGDRKPLFVFDLDSTITKCELLPVIAESVGLGETMAHLTESAMLGNVPFEVEFPRRVELLKQVPVSKARAIAAQVPLNEQIVRFIREAPQRCRVVTGNLDVWIEELILRIGAEGRCACSHAIVEEDRIQGVGSVLNKARACQEFGAPFIAVGDGNNDIEMLKAAEIGIAYGGVRTLSEAITRAADRVIMDEMELVEYLKEFL